MSTLEIVCESCESRMRLSTALLEKIEGKTGRVTCKQCSSKILLDASGDEILVKEGGYAADEALELEQISELPPTADVHLSELPVQGESKRPVGEVSLPPPLPEELRLRRSMRAAAQPNLDELAAAVNFAHDDDEFEAPAPAQVRGDEGSLSPHSIGGDEDESMVSLGREFNSSPFASERDETFNSLYPKPKKREKIAVAAPQVSKAPPAPKAGELHRGKAESEFFEEELPPASAPVKLNEAGELINKADKKTTESEDQRGTSWGPWALAAVALLALGVSLSTKEATQVVIQAPEKSGATKAAPAKVLEEAPAATVEVEAEEEATTESEATTTDSVQPEASAGTTKKAAPVQLKKQTDVKKPAAEVAATKSDEAPAPDAELAEEEEAEEAQPDRPPFSSSAASVAMREATGMASACRRPGDPTGYAKVTVTFAPSGRVTRASVNGPPFAGTETGGCIASRFRLAQVPAFSGEHVTVTKTVAIR